MMGGKERHDVDKGGKSENIQCFIVYSLRM